ncbi:MAG: glycosyltransferase family 2 protein [Phycisphaerae bacterium]
MPERCLLAIPVFNEARHLDRVLDSARRYAGDILVIDDGSTDRTPALLARRDDVEVRTHAENRGYGHSVRCAFSHALRYGYDWLITMDSDEQHEAASIPRFLETARRDHPDVISGTRYPNGHAAGGPAPADRRAINRRITALINQRLGLGITDAFCGFKAYRVAALQALRITVPGYAMPMEFWVQAAAARLRIVELAVPLIYNDPTRHFGGWLDDPAARMAHYREVFDTALAAVTDTAEAHPRHAPTCLPCR